LKGFSKVRQGRGILKEWTGSGYLKGEKGCGCRQEGELARIKPKKTEGPSPLMRRKTTDEEEEVPRKDRGEVPRDGRTEVRNCQSRLPELANRRVTGNVGKKGELTGSPKEEIKIEKTVLARQGTSNSTKNKKRFRNHGTEKKAEKKHAEISCTGGEAIKRGGREKKGTEKKKLNSSACYREPKNPQRLKGTQRKKGEN